MLDPAYQIRIHSLDPTLADVRIEFPDLPADAEVRGRVMGPRCPGISTVEVAYRLGPVGPAPTTTYQILIPEPSFWSAEAPFVYEGSVEFWMAGKREGRKMLSLGLKADSRLVL